VSSTFLGVTFVLVLEALSLLWETLGLSLVGLSYSMSYFSFLSVTLILLLGANFLI